jgi:hypothetical protein
MRGGGIKNNLNDFIHISYYPKRFWCIQKSVKWEHVSSTFSICILLWPIKRYSSVNKIFDRYFKILNQIIYNMQTLYPENMLHKTPISSFITDYANK